MLRDVQDARIYQRQCKIKDKTAIAMLEDYF